MIRKILASVAVLGLAACTDYGDETQTLEFTQHKQTGLCFAVHPSDMAFANVPCTPEVLAMVNGQATAAPVTVTETVR